ncbi:MAG TPA: HD domain-containing phosphohydrolase [Holophagaceae bacterium]|nr:HD domain-containing phosphohydrolase [Holophagaceae bacterium]
MTQVTPIRSVDAEALRRSLTSLSEAIRFRDEGTQSHDEEVGLLSVELGRRLGLHGSQLDRIYLAGIVHDLGKIGVRDDILLKEGPLTPEDRAAMERHPELAAEILRPLPGAEPLVAIILAHHECPDGSGYPRGLRGEAIPLEARILQVADVFCALLEIRPYKGPMAQGEALAWMRDQGPGRFDADCLEALAGVLAET